jgi:hypothetical protein
VNNYKDLSSTEISLMGQVVELSMALDTLGMIIKTELPSTAGRIEGLMDQLRSSTRNVYTTQAQLLLEGHGPFATHLRRNLVLSERPWPEEEIAKFLEPLLPAKRRTSNDAREYREFLWRTLGRYKYDTRNSGWVDDSFPPTDNLLRPALKPWMAHEETRYVDATNVATFPSGLYWERQWSSYSPKRRVLVLRCDEQTVVEIPEEGEVKIWSYVAIERCWVLHQNYVYLPPLDVFVEKFHETFREQLQLWPTPLTQDELLVAVQQQLAQTPLQSKTKDEWESKYQYSSEGFLVGYRKSELEVDYYDAEMFVFRSNNMELRFRFTAEGNSVAFRVVDNKPSYHTRWWAPFPVAEWKDLPSWNKITLAKDLLDTIVRIHDYENRPTAAEPSSESTTAT